MKKILYSMRRQWFILKWTYKHGRAFSARHGRLPTLQESEEAARLADWAWQKHERENFNGRSSTEG